MSSTKLQDIMNLVTFPRIFIAIFILSYWHTFRLQWNTIIYYWGMLVCASYYQRPKSCSRVRVTL